MCREGGRVGGRGGQVWIIQDQLLCILIFSISDVVDRPSDEQSAESVYLLSLYLYPVYCTV